MVDWDVWSGCLDHVRWGRKKRWECKSFLPHIRLNFYFDKNDVQILWSILQPPKKKIRWYILDVKTIQPQFEICQKVDPFRWDKWNWCWHMIGFENKMKQNLSAQICVYHGKVIDTVDFKSCDVSTRIHWAQNFWSLLVWFFLEDKIIKVDLEN